MPTKPVARRVWILAVVVVGCVAANASGHEANAARHAQEAAVNPLDHHTVPTAPMATPLIPSVSGVSRLETPTPRLGELPRELDPISAVFEGAAASPPPTPNTLTSVTEGADLALKKSAAAADFSPSGEPLDTSSLDFHRREFDRIRSLVTELDAHIQAAQQDLKTIEGDIENQWQRYDEQYESVMQSWLPSPRGARVRNFRCMGWKSTSGCTWSGKRTSSQDKSCFSPLVGSDSSGFCVVRDEDTDEYFRVMKTDCTARSPDAMATCRFAPAFANFPARVELVAMQAEQEKAAASELAAAGDGIVLLVMPSETQQAERLVAALRALSCVLPIELWYVDDGAGVSAGQMQTFGAKLAALRPTTHSSKITTRAMEPLETIVQARLYAITHSAFSQVLYLDVATIPLRDPTYLFLLPEFAETGSLFWPDLFHPGTTESNIQPVSLLWEYLDMPFISMFEQDDRQLLIRRDLLAQRGLRVVELFATDLPNIFDRLRLVRNGKDFFRLAWLKTRVPFHMVAVPPSIGGAPLANEPYTFCGSHVVQHGPHGEPLFLHRQPDAAGTIGWSGFTYLQAFDWRRDPKNAEHPGRLSSPEIMQAFRVGTYPPTASEYPRCYGFVASGEASERISTALWSENSLHPGGTESD